MSMKFCAAASLLPALFAAGLSAQGPVPAIKFGWYHNLDADLEGGAEFGSTEYRLNLPLYGKEVGENLKLGFGAGYRFHQLSTAEPSIGDFDLHRVDLSMTALYARENSPWLFWGRVAPGIDSDFDASFSDAFNVTVTGGIGYAFTENFSLVLGGYAGQSFGEYVVYPALGLRWQINETWRMDLVPPDFTVQWDPTDRTRVSFSAFPGGGSWVVDDTGRDFDEIGYRDIRVGVGLDYEIRDQLWVSAWVGANLLQQLETRDSSDRILFEEDIDESIFLYLGLRYDIW